MGYQYLVFFFEGISVVITDEDCKSLSYSFAYLCCDALPLFIFILLLNSCQF